MRGGDDSVGIGDGDDGDDIHGGDVMAMIVMVNCWL